MNRQFTESYELKDKEPRENRQQRRNEGLVIERRNDKREVVTRLGIQRRMHRAACQPHSFIRTQHKTDGPECRDTETHCPDSCLRRIYIGHRER